MQLRFLCQKISTIFTTGARLTAAQVQPIDPFLTTAPVAGTPPCHAGYILWPVLSGRPTTWSSPPQSPAAETSPERRFWGVWLVSLGHFRVGEACGGSPRCGEVVRQKNGYDSSSAICAQSDRFPAHWWGEDGAVQLAVCAAYGWMFHIENRGHRPCAEHAGSR